MADAKYTLNLTHREMVLLIQSLEVVELEPAIKRNPKALKDLQDLGTKIDKELNGID